MKTLPKNIFITGIGTGVGKTLTSAILCEALQADYWKPVQCGNLENSDSKFVRENISNSVSKIHDEAYRFTTAASPHFAAKQENVNFEIEKLQLPETANRLLVEGAGGILVPLSDELVNFDLSDYFKLPVIIVTRNYLGSINHTLLTVEFLDSRNAEILGIIFSGNNYNDNEEIVQHFTQLPILGRIDEAKTIDKKFISEKAQKMKTSLLNHFQL